MMLIDFDIENALEPGHPFLIGQILPAYIGILDKWKIFLCPHSFLFHPSRIKLLVAD